MHQVWLDVNCRPFRLRTVWTIYLFCDPYGIGYVGCTARPIAQRLRDHLVGYESNSRLCRVVKDCGLTNCTLKVLDEAINIEEARRKEIKHLLLCGTLAPNGYNLRKQVIQRGLLPDQKPIPANLVDFI